MVARVCAVRLAYGQGPPDNAGVGFAQTFVAKMQARGYIPADVARGTGVSEGEISRLINGKRLPRYETLVLLARFVGMDMGELEESGPPLSANDLLRQAQIAAQRERETLEGRVRELEARYAPTIRVPKVAQAGSLGVVGSVIEDEIVHYRSQPGEHPESLLAVPVAGDCMEPLIQTGATAIVDFSVTTDLADKDMVLAGHDGDVLVKWYRIRPDGIWLESLRRPPIRPNGETRVLGKVVAFHNPPPKPPE